ncbi:MAG: phosphoglycerate mutase family protein [Actinomycetota bacterium]
MKIFLVRHAHAGQRSPGHRDIYRPLSAEGQDRARQLASVLADQPVDRIMASPATRCVQTLQPLASANDTEVEECQELWEGSSIDEAMAALSADDGEVVVACSHGDIIPGVIERLGALDVPISGRGCELGSIWILDRVDGRWAGARYAGTGADLDSRV